MKPSLKGSIQTSITKHPIVLGIVAYAVSLLLLRLLAFNGLQLDEAEQIVVAQSLEWGYRTQPPLYTLLQRVFFEVFGWNVFAIALLRSVLIGLALLGTWQLGRRLQLTFNQQVLSLLSLALLPQFLWTVPNDLSHSLLLWVAAIGLLVCLIDCVQALSLLNIVKLGLCLCVGLLSKHSFIVLMFLTFVLSMVNKPLRAFWRRPLSILVLILCLLPAVYHYFWVYAHLPWSLATTLNKAGFGESTLLNNIFALFKAYVLFLSPFWLLVLFLFWRSKRHQRLTRLALSPEQKILLFFLLGGFFCMLVMTLLGMSAVRERWLIPVLAPISIFTVSIFAQSTQQTPLLNRFCFGLILLSVIGLGLRPFESALGAKPSRFERQYQVAHQQLPKDAKVVTNDLHLAGQLKLQAPSRDVLLLSRTLPKKILPEGVDQRWLVHVAELSAKEKPEVLANTLRATLKHFGLAQCRLGELNGFEDQQQWVLLTQLNCLEP